MPVMDEPHDVSRGVARRAAPGFDALGGRLQRRRRD